MSPIAAPSMSLEDVAVGARLLWNLPSFLQRPIKNEEARAVLGRRLERREADFLAIAREAIYGQSDSPYRHLLTRVGCSYEDLERLVNREGVEGALHALLGLGVYLTVDEFKGRRPVVRGSTSISADPSALCNPRAALHVPVRSSGSRGAGTAGLIDLAFIRDCAVDLSLHFGARGVERWHKATWETPGSGMLRILQLSAFGAPAARWFSQVAPHAASLPDRYRWGPRLMRWAGLRAARPLPRPEFVPLHEPLPIARWMSDVLRSGGTPHLIAFASSAVRLSQAAVEAGLDLQGSHVLTVGEPLTEARRASIRRGGMEVFPGYGSIECGPVGYGCLAPCAPDDVHLLHDLHAVIQSADSHAADLPPGAILVTSLRLTAPFIMLNVSMGDEALMQERTCGCPLQALGWARHLHAIRSFEKLTSGGITFLDSDVVRVLEEVLPARFGGGPTDYQLVEAETKSGLPSLRLLVHPGIGPLDSRALADTFLAAIGQGPGSEHLQELVWRQAALLHVERKPPLATPSGKILHLRVDDGSQQAAERGE